MDVDYLRPRTIPISETVLWFEFLLDPTLLEKHLAKPNPDPTPSELIIKFLSISPDTYDNKPAEDGSKPESSTGGVSKKHFALKILSLKVAAFLEWDLNVFQSELPFQKQVYLLKDLLSVCTGQELPIPLTLDFLQQKHGFRAEKQEDESNESCKSSEEWNSIFTTDNARFALTLYHRWVLTVQVYRGLQPRNNKTTYVHVPGLQDSNATQFTAVDDTCIASLDQISQASIDYLEKISKQNINPFKCLAFESFVPLHETTETIEQTFEGAFYISVHELRTQIHFDMAMYFLFIRKYRDARRHIIICKHNFENMMREYESSGENKKKSDGNPKFKYCTVTKRDLDGYLEACVGENGGLFQKMKASALNKYCGILEILEADNLAREIPLTHRTILELDIKGAVSLKGFQMPRDVIFKIEVLNTVRSVLSDTTYLVANDFLERLKAGGDQYFCILLSAFKAVLPTATQEEKVNIESYFQHLIALGIEELVVYLQEFQIPLNIEPPQTIPEIPKDEIYDAAYMEYLTMFSNNCFIEEFQGDMGSRDALIQRTEQCFLEEKLVQSMDAEAIRVLLVKLVATNPTEPLWKVYYDWTIPIPLQSVVMSLPLGFLQDFSYILLAKSKQLLNMQDYLGALTLLHVLERETRESNISVVMKLCKLTSWEILLVQCHQLLSDWHKKHRGIEAQNLKMKCRQCLAPSQGNDNIIPRIEIKEYAAAALLALADWDSLAGSSLERQYSSLEICSSIAHAASDLVKYKGNKKLNRDAWDIMLPLFGAGAPKRNSSGSMLHRDSPNSTNREHLHSFLTRIRDATVFTVVISLLTRLHNILKDEPSMELSCDYMTAWPGMVINSNSYNVRIVCEHLRSVLNDAIKYHPDNTNWIKLQGDLDFVYGHFESAMRKYVNAIIVGTDYLARPMSKPLVDDTLIRRMIKTCCNLGCNTQAAVLCQFLDETDYVLAFKSLSEKSNSFDAMDAYYAFIWEPALLEFIVNLHHKRGETKRRQQAISLMGLLELNSNNNEEIQREASAIRKSQFIKALDTQYRQ